MTSKLLLIVFVYPVVIGTSKELDERETVQVAYLEAKPRLVSDQLHPLPLPHSYTMSKREPGRLHISKVKKRRGVGSRVITIPDSDEEDPSPKASSDYARVTKTRVSASAKAEKVSMGSIRIFEEEQLSTPTPVEADVDNSADVVVENVVSAVPAKRRKRANDSVCYLRYRPSVLLNVFQTKMRTFLSLQYILLDDIVSLDGPGDH